MVQVSLDDRYHPIPITDEPEALEERLRYCLAHSRKLPRPSASLVIASIVKIILPAIVNFAVISRAVAKPAKYIEIASPTLPATR
jgi:hypothetical protein